MAQFTFRLDTLFRLRRDTEKERQRDLAQVQQRYLEAEQQLAGIRQEMTSADEALREGHLTGKIDVVYLMSHRRFIAARNLTAMQQLQAMARVQQEVSAARTALLAAARDRKALEKLREKRLEAWRHDQSRREQAETDEVSTQIAFDNLQESSCTH
ncbi:MAG: flagellar export protein FliJ [Phycisphaerae bacterium]